MATADRIPLGKKRYCLTLTETTINRMHEYFRKNHAPKSMLSSMVDELILDVLKTFDELEAAQQRQGGSLGIGDLFSTIGKIMTEKDSEQGKLL
jgi:hypothetical protein